MERSLKPKKVEKHCSKELTLNAFQDLVVIFVPSHKVRRLDGRTVPPGVAERNRRVRRTTHLLCYNTVILEMGYEGEGRKTFITTTSI